MEARITRNADGRYTAQIGMTICQDKNPLGIGFFMPAFVVYESARFDAERDAVNWARKQIEGRN